MPNDFPHWTAVYQQTQCWLAAGCFETLAQDLLSLLRLASGRNAEPPAGINLATGCTSQTNALTCIRGRIGSIASRSWAQVIG
jgi:transposase